jgi:hypothetical protein
MDVEEGDYEVSVEATLYSARMAKSCEVEEREYRGGPAGHKQRVRW